MSRPDFIEASGFIPTGNLTSYARIYVAYDNNPHFPVVPRKVLENVFGRYRLNGYKHFISRFLQLASEEQKFASVTSLETDSGRMDILWDKWVDSNKELESMQTFEPIPGINEKLEVIFLGDAYEFSITNGSPGYRTDNPILHRVIDACIDDQKKDKSWEESPSVGADFRIFFSLPMTDVGRSMMVDCRHISEAVKHAFKVSISPGSLAKKLAESFLGNKHIDIDDKNDDLCVQCTFTGRHAYSRQVIEDMEKRNSPWDQMVMGNYSMDAIPRRASFQRVKGSCIYLHPDVGTQPPEFELRVLTYRRVRKHSAYKGVYKMHEWLTDEAVPKFMHSIAKLHRPDIFC